MAISVPALLDSAQTYASAADSSNEAINLLQIVDASHAYTSGYTRRNYYDSAGQLPTADSSMEGMITLVKGPGAWTGNAMYVCTGTEWSSFLSLDSGSEPGSPIQLASTYGYSSGGRPFVSPTYYNAIERYSFASSGNSSNIGSLSYRATHAAATNSTTYGYIAGGWVPGSSRNLDYYPFASSTSGTSIGTLTSIPNGFYRAATDIASPTEGYVAGMLVGPPFVSHSTTYKFPFAATTGITGSSVGTLPVAKGSSSGASSPAYGYLAAGVNDSILKWAYANDTTISNVGSVPVNVADTRSSGNSSSTHGYNVGGKTSSPVNLIQKYAFANESTTAQVGYLSTTRYNTSSSSGTDYGYHGGGYDLPTPPTFISNVIDRFPFSSDTNASDVGDLSAIVTEAMGNSS